MGCGLEGYKEEMTYNKSEYHSFTGQRWNFQDVVHKVILLIILIISFCFIYNKMRHTH
jgi:hypothetical protein